MDLDAATTCLPVKMLQSKQNRSLFSKLFRSTSDTNRLDHHRALGKSSLKPEDADSDYSSLTDEEKGVLDDWEKYFAKVRLRNSQPVSRATRRVATDCCTFFRSYSVTTLSEKS